jgi:hypothetical protein
LCVAERPTALVGNPPAWSVRDYCDMAVVLQGMLLDRECSVIISMQIQLPQTNFDVIHFKYPIVGAAT